MLARHAARLRSHLEIPTPPSVIERSTAALGSFVRRRAPSVAGPPLLDDRAVGSRVLLVIAGAILGLRLAATDRGLIGFVAGAWGASLAARWLERRMAHAGERAVAADIPFVLERMSTALRSGRTVDGALRLVAPSCRGSLGSAMRDAVRAADLGATRAEIRDRLATVPGDAMQRVVRALERSERLGVPAADVVESLAADLRARAHAEAETQARTAPVRMLFPLAFCFLPAFVLLTIAPIAIEALRTLGGM